jgi:predicted alpha/beta superfamily hydrolase
MGLFQKQPSPNAVTGPLYHCIVYLASQILWNQEYFPRHWLFTSSLHYQGFLFLKITQAVLLIFCGSEIVYYTCEAGLHSAEQRYMENISGSKCMA